MSSNYDMSARFCSRLVGPNGADRLRNSKTHRIPFCQMAPMKMTATVVLELTRFQPCQLHY